MGNDTKGMKKKINSIEPQLEDFRWFWNNTFSSWDNINTIENWYPFPLEFCEQIEESYVNKTPFHYDNKIILFDYKNLKHLQIVQTNAWKKKLILRERPSNLPVCRLSMLNQFSPINTSEEDFKKSMINEMGILFFKDGFDNFPYTNDTFSFRFLNTNHLTTTRLISFIKKEYKERIAYLNKEKGQFSFDKLKQMLIYDFRNRSIYIKYYLSKLTIENFTYIIIQMFLEENTLYGDIENFPFNCNETNIQSTTYYLCLIYALNEQNQIHGSTDYKYYFVSTNPINQLKENEYYYHKSFILASANIWKGLGKVYQDKTIFEIKVNKEPGANYYLNQNPYDVSKVTSYCEETILFPINSCFIVEEIKAYMSELKKNKPITTTIITMRLVTDIISQSIPLMLDRDKEKFGIYEEFNKLPEEHLKNVLFARMRTKHIKYTRKMTNCLSIELTNNDIGKSGMITLSTNLQLMLQLSSFSLIGNDISFEGYSTFNQSLSNLSNLRYLNLGFNNMKSNDILAIHFSLLRKLEFLILRVNRLNENGMNHLVQEIINCKNLRVLDLYGNEIKDEGLILFSKELSNFPYLQSLDIWNCGISNKGMAHFLRNLLNHQEFESLNFKHNSIGGPVVVDLLIRLVKTLPKLKNINFGLTLFTEDQLNTIITTFQAVNDQWFFDVSSGIFSIDPSSHHNTHMTDPVMSYQSELHPSHIKQKKRKYSSDILHIKSQKMLTHILNKIDYYQCIKFLNLNEVFIGDSDLFLLSDILSKLRRIEHLNLGFNNIMNNKGIERISLCLNSLNQLSVLDMSSNNLDDNGLIILSQGMSKCSLKEINLCWNKITNKGLKALMAQINLIKNLHILDLDGNMISDEGIETIALNSHFLTNLTTLNLGKNFIGNQGMIDLSECFRNFTSLIHLNLNNNVFDDQGINEFTLDIQSVLDLHYLNISGNKISAARKEFLISQGVPSSFIL